MTDECSRAILRGHCPDCDADRNAEVLAEDTNEGVDEPSGIWFKSTYSILRCLGCDRRYIRLVQLDSEDSSWDEDPHTGENFETRTSELPTGRLSPHPERCTVARSGSGLTF